MNKYRYVLLLAVVVCATLAGCKENKQEPSLSSDNASERMHAVHRAIDKWGGGAHDKAMDQRAIVGRWNNPLTDKAYYRFNADGTVKEVTLFGSRDGVYRFVSNDVLELDYPGTFYGRNVVRVVYRLLRDALEIKQFDSWIKYNRAT